MAKTTKKLAKKAKKSVRKVAAKKVAAKPVKKPAPKKAGAKKASGKQSLIGKEIQFTAIRIQNGNPVTGILLEDNKEGVRVELTKDIEGMVNMWEAGEKRSFRKELIKDLKLKEE